MYNLNTITICNHLVLGYRVVYMPNHPHANSGGWVYLHRIIMENKLNRVLETWEIVHHIDENKLNNNIENLELITKSEHCIKHHTFLKIITCKVCGIQFLPKESQQTCCSQKCGYKGRIKIKWPTLEELENMLKLKNMVQVGKELGVSDNAVRKHMKKLKQSLIN